MQAVAETLFDVVYLVSVIAIGIRMIRGSRGDRQFLLFGWMAVVLGAGDSFHLVPRAGKLYCPPGAWKVDHLRDYDGLLCAALLCVAAALQGFGQERPHGGCVWSGRTPDLFMHDAAEPMAQRRCAAFLGDLP